MRTILNARALAQRSQRVVPKAVSQSCTASTLRCADARDYHCELRSCCRTNLVRVVSQTVSVLDELGIRYWADYGTILGAVRNPLTTWSDYPWLPQEGRADQPLVSGIIPHDKDADFGVLYSDWARLMKLRIQMERRGFNVRVNSTGASVKIRLSSLNHTNLDLFAWQEAAGGILRRPRYISVDQFKGRDFPKSWLEPVARVQWEGLELVAPADPVAFCAFRYGPNWRKPIAANHDGVRR